MTTTIPRSHAEPMRCESTNTAGAREGARKRGSLQRWTCPKCRVSYQLRKPPYDNGGPLACEVPGCTIFYWETNRGGKGRSNFICMYTVKENLPPLSQQVVRAMEQLGRP